MIKSNKKVTLNTRETYFFRSEPQKLKIVKNGFRFFFKKMFLKVFLSLFSVSQIVPKKREVASYRQNYNSGLSFLPTSLRFFCALAFLEPQFYLAVEQFGAENISLLSRRLVKIYHSILYNKML